MIKLISFLLIFIVLLSCDDTAPNKTEKTDLPDEQLSMENLIKRSVIASLEIPVTENYSLEIQKNHLNEDEFEDAIVLVNRKEHAIQKSKNANRHETDERIGYFGNHNYIFYYDGMTHTVTRPIAVASSALIPLKINFHHIQTEAYLDFTIDTRVKETRWRNFYTIKNGAPKLVFQWSIQNTEDEGRLKTNHLRFDKGSYSLAKDILIYEAELLSELPEDLSSDYELKTKPKGEIAYRFFYNPKEGKYFTNK